LFSAADILIIDQWWFGAERTGRGHLLVDDDGGTPSRRAPHHAASDGLFPPHQLSHTQLVAPQVLLPINIEDINNYRHTY